MKVNKGIKVYEGGAYRFLMGTTWTLFVLQTTTGCLQPGWLCYRACKMNGLRYWRKLVFIQPLVILLGVRPHLTRQMFRLRSMATRFSASRKTRFKVLGTLQTFDNSCAVTWRSNTEWTRYGKHSICTETFCAARVLLWENVFAACKHSWPALYCGELVLGM